MGILTPNSQTQLRGMISGIGGTAGRLASMPTPGTNDIRTTFSALAGAPSIGLPGGGVLGTGSPLGRYVEQAEPAAELPLQQGETQRKLGLAGIEQGAGQLQTEDQSTSLAYRQALQNQLHQLLFGLGFRPQTQQIGSGTFGVLAQLLGI